MDDEEIRRRAQALRALGQQRESELDAQRAGAQAAATQFRDGVRDFADAAAARLRAAGVPTVEALLAPAEAADVGHRSWQRPTWRERLTGFRQTVNGQAAPQPPAQGRIAGWQLPILHPITGQRTDHGQMFDICDYARGDVSGRTTWFLIVFLTVDGRLCFAARRTGGGPPLLYDFDRNAPWVDSCVGKEIADLDRNEISNALGIFRAAEEEWQVGREQAQISLWEAKEYNDRVADGLLIGWHAALEDLLSPDRG
ncbi:hypothetical protein [Streptomyces cellulosae]|uniref:Uncharacterized protein n=1 Tax=Streptomyces cellulosae TaxID=1968 RepID=A0ABW7XTJ3_STRCE